MLTRQLTPQEIQSDKTLYEQFQKVLSGNSDGIVFLKSHDFSNSFRDEHLEGVKEILHVWDSPEHRFFTPEVQQALTELRSALQKFHFELAGSTVRLDSNVALFGFSPAYGPDQRVESGKALNRLAAEAVKAHEVFVLTARGELGV